MYYFAKPFITLLLFCLINWVWTERKKNSVSYLNMFMSNDTIFKSQIKLLSIFPFEIPYKLAMALIFIWVKKKGTLYDYYTFYKNKRKVQAIRVFVEPY